MGQETPLLSVEISARLVGTDFASLNTKNQVPGDVSFQSQHTQKADVIDTISLGKCLAYQTKGLRRWPSGGR
jgi:hypothetical protein